MTLACVPPWIDPIVSTTGSIGLFSRDTIVCSDMTVRAAITTGSMVLYGIAPWPPRPYIVNVGEIEIARNGPAWKPIVPAGIESSSCRPMT